MNINWSDDIVVREKPTKTQTGKSRIHRWLNVEGIFRVVDPKLIENKRVILVDDVITTGSTIESCGMEIVRSVSCELQVLTIAVAY